MLCNYCGWRLASDDQTCGEFCDQDCKDMHQAQKNDTHYDENRDEYHFGDYQAIDGLLEGQ